MIPYGLVNIGTSCLLFIPVVGRWFAISFGQGFSKLDPNSFELDFGLKVVLNVVDHEKLKSADIKTPDENTLARRTQTSRDSNQTAFSFDFERDLVRGIAGKPASESFGSFVSGKDSLTISRKVNLQNLPTVCEDVYFQYKQDRYKLHFDWIDKIRDMRDPF